MRKSITIQIPKPCLEDWDKMTPKDKGRHCSSCNKTVIDFTKQNDEQIIKTFEKSSNLCGRFKNQQLNREIVLSRKDKNNYRNWLASGLLAFLAIGSQKTFAQGEPIKTVQNDTLKTPHIKGKIATSVLQHKVLKGVVTAKSDGLPLPGVNVIVEGTSRSAQTNFDGKFSIKVSKGEKIKFSFVGFKTINNVITETSEMIISMEDDIDALESVVVGGAIAYCSSDYNDPSITNKEQKAKYETRQKQKAKWKAKKLANRLKWKAERLSKKLKRQEKRNSKKKQ